LESRPLSILPWYLTSSDGSDCSTSLFYIHLCACISGSTFILIVRAILTLWCNLSLEATWVIQWWRRPHLYIWCPFPFPFDPLPLPHWWRLEEVSWKCLLFWFILHSFSGDLPVVLPHLRACAFAACYWKFLSVHSMLLPPILLPGVPLCLPLFYYIILSHFYSMKHDLILPCSHSLYFVHSGSTICICSFVSKAGCFHVSLPLLTRPVPCCLRSVPDDACVVLPVSVHSLMEGIHCSAWYSFWPVYTDTSVIITINYVFILFILWWLYLLLQYSVTIILCGGGGGGGSNIAVPLEKLERGCSAGLSCATTITTIPQRWLPYLPICDPMTWYSVRYCSCICLMWSWRLEASATMLGCWKAGHSASTTEGGDLANAVCYFYSRSSTQWPREAQSISLFCNLVLCYKCIENLPDTIFLTACVCVAYSAGSATWEKCVFLSEMPVKLFYCDSMSLTF